MADQGVDYEAVLQDLEAKKANLETVIAGIKALMALGVVSSSGPQSKVEDGGRIDLDQVQAGAFFGMSIPEATRKLLDGLRRPLGLQAISDALMKGGFATNSKDFPNTVGATLRRQSEDGDIVRVGNTSDWGLREWYPGLRRRPKVKLENGIPPEPGSEP